MIPDSMYEGKAREEEEENQVPYSNRPNEFVNMMAHSAIEFI